MDYVLLITHLHNFKWESFCNLHIYLFDLISLHVDKILQKVYYVTKN